MEVSSMHLMAKQKPFRSNLMRAQRQKKREKGLFRLLPLKQCWKARYVPISP